MPYILKADRLAVTPQGGVATSAGELNYQFTVLMIAYMKQNNCYQGINDVLGALDGAKLEFYRRWVAPYEDYKNAVNGDVYPTGDG
jgi:hypothetical protein